MKKFCIYLLCGLLSCSVVSASYYRSVHAMEWVGGALAFEEALKWGLALLGITATAGMTNEYWENYGDDFTEYAIENGATQQEVTEWQMKLCEGILDKGSAVWDKFKSWASSLVNGTSSSVPSVGASSADVVTYLNDTFNFNISTNKLSISNVYGFAVSYQNKTYPYVYLFLNDSSYSISNYGSSPLYKQLNPTNINYLYYTESEDIYHRPQYWSSTSGTIIFDKNYTWYFSSNISNVSSNFSDYVLVPFGDNSGTVADENFDSAFPTDIDNADVISSVLPDEDDAEVSLPYPGVSDSDNSASADAYDDIIDAINDGTITQEQGIEKIQELLKIIVYDDVTDDVLPNRPDDDTGENKKKDDVINENKNNMGFSLAGLENVFPFCIPFDIYAFMTILVAEPVAPELDYPIQNVNGEVEEIHIDLSPFEPVAVVVRYVFDFLFIIGLGLLTRSLIGGGSSD